jgi:hypothetical protein
VKPSQPVVRSSAQRPAEESEPTLPGEDVRRIFRRLSRAGFDATGAGNLSGVAVGLRPTSAGWSQREITAMLFLRELVRQERIVH